MTQPTNRRDFLRQTTLAGVGFWVAGTSVAAESRSPSEKLNIALIAAGGQGGGNLNAVSSENIVALCDVDQQRAADAFKRFPRAQKYQDYRKMLEEQKDIDAVVVSTPDHHHAPASVMAMKLGKHVYCEKPLTHDVYEARVMRETAARYQVATQMGNQGTASEGLRRGVELIQAGVIGPVREVHVWTNRPIWPQGMDRPRETKEVPSHLNWDLWLGPAQERPYHPAYVPFSWRGWWDFGTGALGDMACHTANLPFLALKLGYPTSIEAESSEVKPESYPTWSTIRFQFPARGDMPPVKLTWYDGRREKEVEKKGKKGGEKKREMVQNLPSLPQNLEKYIRLQSGGCLLIGDKGILYSPDDYGTDWRLIFDGRPAGYKVPEPTLPRSPGHHREWINACKGGKPAMSNFNYAGLLTEAILLGNVALRVGKKIEWDGENLKVTNVPEANQYIRREYRKGWTL